LASLGLRRGRHYELPYDSLKTEDEWFPEKEATSPGNDEDAAPGTDRVDGVKSIRGLVPRAMKLKYHGVLRASSSVVDRALGIDTAGKVDLADLGLADPERVGYEAGSWLDLPRVLRPGEVTRDDVFLDLGCGKGRAVLMASLYPFGRVTGVELSPDIAGIARRNLETFRRPTRCGTIEIVVTDAVDYTIPDDVTVVYLFNPFRGRTFDAVIDNLIASIDRNPRRVRLIYRNAMYEDQLLGTGRARLVRSSPGLRPSREWREAVAVRLYALEPAPKPEQKSFVEDYEAEERRSTRPQ
jgi:SAM-dependent methyltransferase